MFRYIRTVGLLFLPPIAQGKPNPVVSWLKDGQPLDTKRANVRNSDRDSILFIRSSQREDSGVYEMTVKVDSFEDKAAITLQIVGKSHVCMHSTCHRRGKKHDLAAQLCMCDTFECKSHSRSPHSICFISAAV